LAQRVIRLFVFALVVFVALYLAGNIGLAWIYVDVLTHPACQTEPRPMEDLPMPQEIQLNTADGLALRAWYYPAKNGVALLALGGTGGALGNNPPPVAFLVGEGFGMLQIDSRACSKPPTPVTLGAKEVLDAQAGLDFLLSRPEVERVGAIGFSMGGATAIRTAARRSEIEAVVAVGGYFNLGDDFVEPGTPKPLPLSLLLHTIAGAFWLQTGENPWQISPLDDLPRISPRPVLLIYGEYEVAAGRALRQFEAAREPKELWIVPGGDHGKNYQIAPQEYERRALQFLSQALLSPK
jgi:fermentation-respiration switch protein FrsA (DUF1100 family)